MTDTDKLKRLAEAARGFGCEYVGFDPAAILALIAENERLKEAGSILAMKIGEINAEKERLEELYDLTGRQCDGWMSRAKSAEKQRDKAMQSVSIWIEEHDRIKFQRDEAVALMREFVEAVDKRPEMWGAVFAFLARIDAKEQE